jgi:hypothetical protein
MTFAAGVCLGAALVMAVVDRSDRVPIRPETWFILAMGAIILLWSVLS